MKTSRIESITQRKLTNEKCKIQTCSRLRRISSGGLSSFCKIHEAYIFLVKLKYSLKKLFRTLTSGFAILLKQSGEFCSARDFCSFLNFVMIPFLQEDVQNLFEVLGRSLNSKNTSVIRIKDLKKIMKSKSCEEIIDVEIRIVFEIINKTLSQSSIESIIDRLDFDKDGFVSSEDFVRVLSIRENQAYFLFSKYFNAQQIPVSSLKSLFPENKKSTLTFLDDLEKEDKAFFPIKMQKLETEHKKQVNSKDGLIENIRDKLKMNFEGFLQAFKYYANSQMEIGFFQIRKILMELGFVYDDKSCQSILLNISSSHVIRLKEFKEFWCNKKGVCNYEVCVKSPIENEEFCKVHMPLKKKRAAVLMEKVKNQTNAWKSARKRLKFYNDLEFASSQYNLSSLREKLNTILPASELHRTSLESIHSIIGRSN